MAKLIITSPLQPWFDGEPKDKGSVIETDDAAVVKHFLDNDLAIEIPAEDAKPAAKAKG